MELVDIFSQIEDKRRDLGKQHKLNDILVMSIIAVICGADSYNEIEDYCKAKEEWLTNVLDLKSGIPSHDTFNRVLSSIDYEKFENCFIQWVSGIVNLTVDKEIINIDGKTVRGAKENGGKSPVHLVSAWASKNNLVLGQVKTNEKSNEITAIPELIEKLCVDNSIITIDAMGCQTTIVDKIIDANADYVIAVKLNQEQLYQDIEDEFRFGKEILSVQTENIDHGRIETRKCSVIKDFKFIESETKWTGIQSIIKIDSIREFKNSDKETQYATRYYISSLDSTPHDFNHIIRSHWGIENKLHWVLDVVFREDQSRKRTKNAANNFAILLKIALNILKNDKVAKLGIKGKRLKAGWDNNYLMQLINL
ncbi:ISAs1 family transposase [Myroides sp. M-43]|uniref:ISAs1 family transposase n=1 Tax=Myroides oncorhynchi TaxID=2893756 RepID=UPI001E3F2DE6|nr:ISAs1 family transposase [Myroides oncorhynchi]MCC9041853.1 ISAs1 family transposase [Myroides oncorhynchi]